VVSALHVSSLLPMIADQAGDADTTRSVSRGVIDALKGNDVMRLSASGEIGGLAAPIADIGAELEATATACGSTAWCLWNHLCTFHFFCGLLGPDQADHLASITAQREWVCFPAGAGTGIGARADGQDLLLSGVAAFGSGARYADHAGVIFMPKGEKDVRFALVPTAAEGFRVDPTWKAMSLRASATDHVRYDDVRVPLSRIVAFPSRPREIMRDPSHPVIHHRYREDWVGLSDLWLGAMAVGVAQASLTECCENIQGRAGIMGVKMIDRPTIHVNLGQAGAMIGAARASVYEAMRATDLRIAGRVLPTEADYLGHLAAAMSALKLCDDAMRLILRVLGGNGLREGANFERRYRDFQAMPLHINAHPDRVSEQFGRHLLGLPPDAAF